MAEVLAEFADSIAGDDAVLYRAQAAGAATADGMWEGWIEFIPIAGGAAVRTPRETTQPNHGAAAYWATGLTTVYLEGALDRALKPSLRRAASVPKPAFDEPAPDMIEGVDAPAQLEVPGPDPVLDPFAVYKRGEIGLRRQLAALAAWHLVNIIVAYDLTDEPTSALAKRSASSLVELIVAAVRDRPER
jgi:hypothetical protein